QEATGPASPHPAKDGRRIPKWDATPEVQLTLQSRLEVCSRGPGGRAYVSDRTRAAHGPDQSDAARSDPSARREDSKGDRGTHRQNCYRSRVDKSRKGRREPREIRRNGTDMVCRGGRERGRAAAARPA